MVVSQEGKLASSIIVPSSRSVSLWRQIPSAMWSNGRLGARIFMVNGRSRYGSRNAHAGKIVFS